MAGRKDLQIDKEEADYAIDRVNKAIPYWNRHWNEQGTENDCGVQFIAGGDPYRVMFRDCRTGRVYGIVAPHFEPYEGDSRVPIPRGKVRRVVRITCFERDAV